MQVEILRLPHFDPKWGLPHYATTGSAGVDLRACESVTLLPFARGLVKTGIALALPQGVECQIRPRSGLALKQGITVLNSPGTIDSDYRGEIGVILVNLSQETVILTRGERIAQAVFAQYITASFIEVSALSKTIRGAGGFGSTGGN